MVTVVIAASLEVEVTIVVRNRHGNCGVSSNEFSMGISSNSCSAGGGGQW